MQPAEVEFDRVQPVHRYVSKRQFPAGPSAIYEPRLSRPRQGRRRSSPEINGSGFGLPAHRSIFV
jgi:hypothetical protein